MLSGVVGEQLTDKIIIDVQGVGYGVYVTVEDQGSLAVGKPAKLYIYEYVREQAHDLFGFLSRDTQQLFEQLLGVNGVGPRMALNVLSVSTSNYVRIAISTGDVKTIQQAQGVGKKVAERIIVDLKDKVGLPGVDLSSTGMLQSQDNLLKDEAVEGLVVLGYSPQDAAAALQSVNSDLPTEERIKEALKGAAG